MFWGYFGGGGLGLTFKDAYYIHGYNFHSSVLTRTYYIFHTSIWSTDQLYLKMILLFQKKITEQIDFGMHTTVLIYVLNVGLWGGGAKIDIKKYVRRISLSVLL